MNTAMRYIAILKLIPEAPKRISTSQIIRKLEQENEKYGVTARSIQRDLETLSEVFPITSEQTGRLNYWFIARGEPLMQVPSMGQSTALALRLAQEYLTAVMPASALELLERYFTHANQVLAGTKLAKWPAKVKIIHRGPALIPPKINPAVQDVVYQGLLESKKISVTYKRRGAKEAKTYPLSPLGIVSRDGLIYLVASVYDYDDVAQYALHRLSKAELLDEPARIPAGFDLDKYVHSEKEFSYPRSAKKIKLCALFSPGAGYHLYESKLSGDQTIEKQPDGRLLVKATVEDTDELHWWLLGFGGGVELKSPRSLREAIKEVYRGAMVLYGK